MNKLRDLQSFLSNKSVKEVREEIRDNDNNNIDMYQHREQSIIYRYMHRDLKGFFSNKAVKKVGKVIRDPLLQILHNALSQVVPEVTFRFCVFLLAFLRIG